MALLCELHALGIHHQRVGLAVEGQRALDRLVQGCHDASLLLASFSSTDSRSCRTASRPSQGSLRNRFSRAGALLMSNWLPLLILPSSSQRSGTATGAPGRPRKE